MVHQQLHTLGVSIVVESLDVEVGVGRHEVEHIALPHVRPVFPAHVPAFHEHLVKTVLGGEVDITLHVLVVGFVRTVGCHLRPVDLIKMDGGEVVRVVPGATSHNHLPPHTAVLGRMDPTGVIKCTRLVEVQDEVR